MSADRRSTPRARGRAARLLGLAAPGPGRHLAAQALEAVPPALVRHGHLGDRQPDHRGRDPVPGLPTTPARPSSSACSASPRSSRCSSCRSTAARSRTPSTAASCCCSPTSRWRWSPSACSPTRCSPSPSIAVLFVAELLGTAAYCFQSPTRNALTPRLVPAEKLTAALAIDDVIFTLARTAGPAVGGLLIAAGRARAAPSRSTCSTFGASFVVDLAAAVRAGRAGRRPAEPALGPRRAPLRADPQGAARRSSSSTRTRWSSACRARCSRPSRRSSAAAPECSGSSTRRRTPARSLASLVSGWVQHVRRQGVGVCIAASLWGVAIAAFGFSDGPVAGIRRSSPPPAPRTTSARSCATRSCSPRRPIDLRGRLSGIELAQVASAPQLGNVEAGAVAALTSVRFSIVSGGML